MNTKSKLTSGLAGLLIGAGALTNGCATNIDYPKWMSTDNTPITEPRVDLNSVRSVRKIEPRNDGLTIPAYEVKFGKGIHAKKVVVKAGDGSYYKVDLYYKTRAH